ncbi:MAG: aspartate ammonia-lyase [Candidatus Micrarchaeota archaeon]|nr:aspartate ammonia-lyase [Candidatus Micrarchaeota archaeon]
MRTEEDSLGRVSVPSDAYYGAFTQRALDNFPISGIRFQDEFITAYSEIKRAAAIANSRLGMLDKRVERCIVRACDDIADGKLNGQFPIDVFQAGAGTSTNMNLNEVIANRALEIMGRGKGDYKTINPNDHVNMSQSTNDTFQSAVHIAAHVMIEKDLLSALHEYQGTMMAKAREFSRIIKSGRTHVMDAVPITLGQEFYGYSIEHEIKMIRGADRNLLNLSVGGTAVGTGLNTHPRFRELFFKELNRSTKSRFVPVKNNFAMTQNLSYIAEMSSQLRNLGLKLIKAANDIRLMSSGPHVGLGEITIPEVQPGSSIMPGKVNPSMAEMMTMACFRAIGNDLSIAMAAQAGQFELNVFGPIAGYCLLESVTVLSESVGAFSRRCVAGIKPNRKRLGYYFSRSSAVATALSPILGYAATAKLVKEADRREIGIRELVLEKRLMDRKELDRILDPSRLTSPNLPLRKKAG